MDGATTQHRQEKHVDSRIAKYYPVAQYPTTCGGIIPELKEVIKESADAVVKPRSFESAFEMKQSTMPDGVTTDTDLFQGVRPHLVVEEASVDRVTPLETHTEYALGEIATTDIVMSSIRGSVGITVFIQNLSLGLEL